MWTGDDIVDDVSAGLWIDDSLRRFAETHRGGVVGTLVPEYAAYARVLHPAGGHGSDLVTWREVATANGRTAHPLMEWAYIQSPDRPPTWDQSPPTGLLIRSQAQSLASILSEYTASTERVWFGVWEGNTILDDIRDRGGRIRANGFGLFVIADSLTAAGSDLDSIPACVWWPDDRSWFVATNPDLMATYVGGSDDCIAAVVDSELLEAFPVAATDKVTWDADTVNPRQ